MTVPATPERPASRSGRRLFVAGIGLAALYGIVCLVTAATGRVRVRPLFEGFAPPAPYRWVNPPPRFAAGNSKPSGTSATIKVEGGRSAAGAVATDDGQFLANLGAGAVSAPPDVSQLQVKVTPVDPATLGPLPSGRFADGNAYRLDLTLAPGPTRVTTLAAPGNVVMNVPADGSGVLYSPDGGTWQELTTQLIGGSRNTLGVQFDRPGYYLGAASSDVTGAAAPSKSGGSSTATIVLVVAGIVVLVAVLIVGPVLWKRRSASAAPPPRRVGTRPGARTPARRPPSQGAGTRPPNAKRRKR